MNKHRSSLKRWLREWALIDGLVLGIGILFLAGYLLGFRGINPQSPEAALIPNLIVTLLGSWVSVRIIDRIIRSREEYHSTRRNVVSDFMTVKGLLDGLFPRPTTTEHSNLLTWKNWVTEHHDSRYKHLNLDERLLADKCAEIIEVVAECTMSYLEQNYHVSDTLDKLKKNVVECVEPRKQVRKLISEYLYEYGTKVLFEEVDLDPIAMKLSSAIDHAKQFLSSEEESLLRNAVERMKGKTAFNYEEIIHLNLNIREIPQELIWTQFEWYRALDAAHDFIVERPTEESQHWVELLVIAEARIEREKEQYPLFILNAGKKYLFEVNKLAPIALRLENLSALFSKSLDELRRNVRDETAEE